ncbi:MAG: hypothetical protein F6K10_10625 [Moorea sp. SIO2B7]|nr:hypothetical protein [Moorena sp. SIO2B7]
MLRFSLLINLGIGVTIASMFVLFPNQLFELLTNHLEAIAVIRHQVYWLLPILVCISLTFVLDQYFMGLTKSMIVLKSRVGAIIFGFLPVVLIGWPLHSSALLWFALLLYKAARGLLLGMMFFSTTKDLEPEKMVTPT